MRTLARAGAVILLWLALGAAASVLVAWGLVGAAWAGWTKMRFGGTPLRHAGAGDGLLTRIWPRPMTSEARGVGQEFIVHGGVLTARVRAGFPAPCVEGEEENALTPGVPPTTRGLIRVRGDTRTSLLLRGDTLDLPYHVRWPGLAVNAAAYGAAGLAAWTGLAALRRRRAARAASSGLCPHCGYDRAGLAATAPCLECRATTSAATNAPRSTPTSPA